MTCQLLKIYFKVIFMFLLTLLESLCFFLVFFISLVLASGLYTSNSILEVKIFVRFDIFFFLPLNMLTKSNANGSVSMSVMNIFYFELRRTQMDMVHMNIYFSFQLGTVHLCRSVIRSIETARIFDFEEFPRRDKVS